MDAYFYSMTKRENATTQPSGSGHHYDNIVLKEPTSIMEPVIRLHMGAGLDPVGFNYCYIPAFERFYWVRDWIAEPGYNWTAVCKEDVLATYAVAIGNSTQYILRSSNASRGDVIDTLYPATGTVNVITNTAASPYDFVAPTVDGACYVIGIVNRDTYAQGRVGAVSYYVVSPASMAAIMDDLMDPGTLTGFVSGDSSLTDSVFKSLYNPLQYLVSCMFCPITPSLGSAVTTLYYGPYDIPVSGVYHLNIGGLPASTGSVGIPKHPQASTRGVYLNMSPFSKYQIEIRPFGWIPLDPADLQGYDTLYYWIYFDPISGSGTLYLSTNSNRTNILYEQSAVIGVPIQLAQMSRDYVGSAMAAVGGAVGAVASGAMGNIPGAIASGVSGIANAAEALMPQMQTQGANGSFAELIMSRIALVGRFLLVVDEDNDDLGRPYCHKGVISDTGGYLLIANPDISIPEATQAEMEEVKRYMAGGFFYV